MRWIYISPHLDDAVLSAGGLIHEQVRAGLEVEIWTILCGFPTGELSPFAQVLHYEWGIPAAADLIAARRAEDINAARIVGAKTVHFDFLDCIYRRGKNEDWLYVADVFVPLHKDDADLPAQISASIATRLKPDDNLVCQFAIGSHVDHILVRRAVDLLKRPIFYAADIPYLFRAPEELAPQVIGMQENTHGITESALGAWQNAILEYASQVGTLFESPAYMRAKIQEYSAKNGGIRLWKPN
jgi:LmbE family N-acetylglucosaminyl deacetylase